MKAQVLAISCDSRHAQKQWATQQGFTFPVLSDFWPHGAVARAYGVFNEQLGCANRATFVHRHRRQGRRHVRVGEPRHPARARRVRGRARQAELSRWCGSPTCSVATATPSDARPATARRRRVRSRRRSPSRSRARRASPEPEPTTARAARADAADDVAEDVLDRLTQYATSARAVDADAGARARPTTRRVDDSTAGRRRSPASRQGRLPQTPPEVAPAGSWARSARPPRARSGSRRRAR